MIMMEFREEQYDRILEKGKKAKNAICELIESLYKCEESEYDEDYEHDEDEYGDDTEIGFRGRGGYRRNMRMRRYGHYRRHDGRYAY